MNSLFNRYFIKGLKLSSVMLNDCHISKTLLNRYNIFIKNYTLKRLRPYLKEAYHDIKMYNSVTTTTNNNTHGVIWVFWWQGKSNMPYIVKRCIQSMRKHSHGHKIILVTKYNIKQYINIPSYIYEKLNKGKNKFTKKISFTHFSDIVRVNLLKNYGGLWMDSTIYCTSDIPKKYFSYLYTSGGYKHTLPKFVNGRWTGFLIGGCKNNNLFRFMSRYFNLYWKYNNYQIDYFLIDYGLYFAYNHNIGKFADCVNNIAPNSNPHLFMLEDYLSKPFDRKKWNKMNKDTLAFKLSYKIPYINNGKTFASKLLNN